MVEVKIYNSFYRVMMENSSSTSQLNYGGTSDLVSELKKPEVEVSFSKHP